ncbi:hypothetical protein H7H82_15770 [Mycobacterium heidelbergense]|uniref:hypothetical protein n=1 Tax=Mycobacterium heidelbergense TaxID=53376 RepID=UPI00115060AC|nr:hypothetical protein [Mycobacterium heidelbergense]MCV7052033.1 hypothetical protein [Mycobacterium heidelbergense]
MIDHLKLDDDAWSHPVIQNPGDYVGRHRIRANYLWRTTDTHDFRINPDTAKKFRDGPLVISPGVKPDLAHGS